MCLCFRSLVLLAVCHWAGRIPSLARLEAPPDPVTPGAAPGKTEAKPRNVDCKSCHPRVCEGPTSGEGKESVRLCEPRVQQRHPVATARAAALAGGASSLSTCGPQAAWPSPCARNIPKLLVTKEVGCAGGDPPDLEQIRTSWTWSITFSKRHVVIFHLQTGGS